jgi:hypothetical protein
MIETAAFNVWALKRKTRRRMMRIEMRGDRRTMMMRT